MQAPTIFPIGHPAGLIELIAKAQSFAQASTAPSTLRALRSDWDDFVSFCRLHQFQPLPATPEVIALYLADRASSLAPQTLKRRLTSITVAHRAAGFMELSPASTKHLVVGRVLRGIRRSKGVEQRGKDPLLAEQMRALVRACREDLQGTRDRALLLVGFAGGFRRSELAAIPLSAVEWVESGVVMNKVGERAIMRQTGHRSSRSLDRYVRVLGLFEDNAAAGLGL